LINSTLARRSQPGLRRARAINGVEHEIISHLRGGRHTWCRGSGPCREFEFIQLSLIGWQDRNVHFQSKQQRLQDRSLKGGPKAPE
jgi:hypothetical protein